MIDMSQLLQSIKIYAYQNKIGTYSVSLSVGSTLYLLHTFFGMFFFIKNRYFILSIILVVVETLLLIVYSIATYALLHVPSGFVKSKANATKSLQFNSENVFSLKKNQERLIELKYFLMKKKNFMHTEQFKQYIERYQETSFCDRCEFVKPPRAYHCPSCDKCILRRQKHSDLIGECIGEGNMKIFVQYMLVSIILCGYMIITLIIISVGEHHQLNDFSDLQLCLFAFEEMILCSCFLLSIKEFSISYYHIVENITQTEAEEGIISICNPFKSKQKYYEKMFNSKLDYLKINKIGDFNYWLQMEQTN